MWQRLTLGLRLLSKSLGVIWNDKTLLAFPMISTGVIVSVLWLLYISVGPDKIRIFVNTFQNQTGVQFINWGWYITLLLAYLVMSVTATFFNAALIGAAYLSMNERDSIYRDGVAAAVKCLPSTFIWAVVNATFGIFISMLDKIRFTSRLVHKLLGSVWGIFTYFVMPVMVIEGLSVFTAIGRSARIMSEAWGEALSARVGMGLFLVILNIVPIVIAPLGYIYFPNMGPLISLILVCWVAFSMVLAQAAKSVLTIVLYQYAAHGQPPVGWDPEVLAEAFEDRRAVAEREALA